ncbi:lectin-like protein, partial [Bacillus velezensis]|uniref:lectin-like protein n=1 Tax=Bacillus velezensis TaxID=492670 RepID=UPI002FFDF095
MQSNEARKLCNNYRGQVVRIYDKSGNEHYGRISKVSNDRVWIEPIDQQRQNSNYSNNRSSNSSNRNRNDFNRERSNRNYSNRDYSNRNYSNRNYSNRD